MTGPGQLVLRVMVLVAVLVAGLVATALTHASWLLPLTLAGLVAAAAAVAVSVNAMLTEDDRAAAPELYRGPVAALAGVVALALVLAVALPIEDSQAVAAKTPDAASAAATVRSFLASAVLDDNAYEACQYLSLSEQRHVAALAGYGQTCRAALLATQPSLAGVHSEGALHALHLQVSVRDGTAFVTAATAVFVLRPATPSDAAAFEAPSAAWRIVGGATAVLLR
jgi:hypothetical protein